MPFQLVILRGRSEARVHRLGSSVTSVGRHEDCQLQLKGSQVSRRHCEFVVQDGVVQLKDLGSSNGTFVNGEKVDGQRALNLGDEITIGGIKFRLEDSSAPAAAVAPLPADDDPNAALPFDDDETVRLTPPASVAAPGDDAEPDAPAPAKTPAGPELGEDAVADFLLDLDIEDDDRP